MGYTHYWTSRGFTDKEWSQLAPATKEIIARAQKSGIAIAGLQGEDAAIIDDRIVFNGAGNAGCEPFVLGRTSSRGFCKTNWQPYDAVVVAVLVAAESTGALTWTSDGKAADHEAGRKLAEDIA
jgi:hypothetical protein